MLTGCKILQAICAIIIVLLILITIMLLIGAIGFSGNAAASAAASATADPSTNASASSLGMAGYGTAAILIWAAVNIGITYIFMKIFKDCADVQRVLEKVKLSRKPEELRKSIENMQKLVDNSSLSKSPIEPAPQEAYIPQKQ